MPGPNSIPAAKAKNIKYAFKELIKSTKKWHWWIAFASVLSAASAIVNVFVPKILGDMTTSAVDSLQTTGAVDWGQITSSLITLIILFAVISVLNYGQGLILAIVTAKYTKLLRDRILDKITRLPISYFDKHQFGDTLSRMSNDIDILVNSFSQEIDEIISSLATLVGVTIMMVIISVPLSIIAFVTIPLSVFCVGKITTYAQKFFSAQQTILGELNSHIEEDYSGQLVIKANSYEPTAIEKFEGVNKRLAETARKAQFFSSLSMPVTHIFTNLSYVAICIAGGYSVINGGITIGNLQAFLQYTSRFNRPIAELAETTAVIQLMLAASERIFEFLNETEETPDSENAQTINKVKGAVEFHDVCFSYDKIKPIIKNFSAKIEPGMQVAIVGPTGAGKTTIINLLMRFYDPDSGFITIDGVPTKEMKRSDVRKLFGMVLQDTWLFSGTVEENLSYGKQDASLEEIKRAAKTSDINHVIESLPHSYKTIISEDSDNISAGEKQLLTIARAMVANPPMMILDEATSNVDTRTEQLIQDAFEKLTSDRTSFVIAHRLSTIRNADLILVMRDGNIVEQGNHEKLLKAGGFYAELYNSQFKE